MLEQYASRDIYKGKVFTIYIDYHGEYVTARLVIEGLSDEKILGQSWPDQYAALDAVSAYARDRIEDLSA